MSKIIIGKAGGKDVGLDLDVLLRTRLLVQADSGGGKSWLLRRLAEQLFGKVQTIIIDPEGEFATLREKFSYVLVGKGGETPADPRSAGMVAHKLLELRASAVCDIYELKHHLRHQWVKLFLEGMIEAPKNLWRPCVIIVDEAHVYCPEKGKGESEAFGAMADLCTRGRKRGFCAVFATQRLGQLSKDASSQLQNRLIGPTFEDINRKRAADVLGILKSEERAFFNEIQLLEPGRFFALGRAISTERVLVSVGAVETTHPEMGSAKHAAEPPPPPEKVKALLPKLKDLPQAAEEKARTEADLRKELREVRQQLRAAQSGVGRAGARPLPKEVVRTVVDNRAIEAAVKKLDAQRRRELAERDKALAKMKGVLIQVGRLVAGAAGGKLSEIQDVRIDLPKPAPASESAPRIHPAAGPERSRGERVPAQPRRVEGRSMPPPDGLTPKQFGILQALAEFEAIGRNEVPRTWIAARSGSSHRSSAYGNNLGALRAAGFIDYGTNSSLRLTDEGRGLAPSIPAPLSSDEMLESCLKIVSPKQGAILRSLVESYPEAMKRNELAEATGQSPNSSAYGNNLGALRSAGMVEYGPESTVKCADWLFID